MAGLFECRIGGKFVDVVATIGQNPFLPVDEANPRFAGYDIFQSRIRHASSNRFAALSTILFTLATVFPLRIPRLAALSSDRRPSSDSWRSRRSPYYLRSQKFHPDPSRRNYYKAARPPGPQF